MSYEIIHIKDADGIRQIRQHVSQSKHVFLDTETTGLDPFSDELILIQVMAADKVFILNVAKIGSYSQNHDSYQPVITLLESNDVLKVGHNLKFDIKFLNTFFRPHGINYARLYDTYLAEELLAAGMQNPAGSPLEALAYKYLQETMDKSLQNSFKGGELTDAQIDYAANDVRVLEPILKKQSASLKTENLVDVASLEFSIIPAVAGIELAGMRLNPAKLDALKARLQDELMHAEAELNLVVYLLPVREQSTLVGIGVNYSSPQQMKEILNKIGIPVNDTSNETLEMVDHPFAKHLLNYRKVSKLLASFVNKLPEHVNPKTGRIHADFFQLGAESGRFTCSSPNLQQIPREQEWRDLFSAEEGRKIITADYSQIELRILAEYSQDPAFLEAYRKGGDLHTKTAAAIFRTQPQQVTKDQRNAAKTINFGICYGMGPQGLSASLKIPKRQAKDFITSYFRNYPKVKKCLDALGSNALKYSYSRTMSGRKRYFSVPEDDGSDEAFKAISSIERKGRNTPIQGTCGDIIKKALQYLWADLQPFEAHIINVVHDEIVIEAAEGQAGQIVPIVKDDMIKAGKHFLKSVPVEVDIAVDTAWKK
jgi:DNA polymerase-1